MEEGFGDYGIWKAWEDKGVYVAFAMLSPEIAKLGHLRGNDILSGFCFECETDEEAFDMARKIINIGYVYQIGTPGTAYMELAEGKRWKLFHFLMCLSGAYADARRLKALIYYLDQKNIDPFLDYGTSLSIGDKHYEKYLKFRTARENARIASIALIGVGKRRNRLYSSVLDVMRVISRVVWSERCDEKWSE